MGEISVKTGNNARNGGKNSLNRLIRCVCGKKIGPDPRNFNQRVSLGRNDLLIRTFPKYEQWLKACYERASAYNLQFSSPLDENEVIGVAKSIAKWTNGNFTKESFDDYIIKTHTKDVQSIRGGRSRGVGRLKGSIVANSIETLKPWVKESISRATWYRRNK
ncbi:primase C-terminal domain-containing protein [Klebsiella pneumoniae]|uniref:primase C-terminal domain-containing protein n=2 Tax=Klebsiella pneumoniae TaxID=573 RepID=UPI00284CFA21|nr:primase C-terminal domain-containing protein [Klebsiella pneumoniae]MDR4565289.1 primase C-terminal domain-containing protein [Klebsiella pneumoniae]